MNNSKPYDVIVIGGGASGMMAAGRAAERGARVLLLEKNKNLGEKLKLTGDGRCNITNAKDDVRELLSHYGSAKDALFSPFSQFGVKDTFNFFESRGLPLVVEARERAFPNTQSALSVVTLLEKYLRDHRVTIKREARVAKLMTKNNKITGVVADNIEYSAKTVILATGGLSHPETGSTGDGFRFLAKLGHTIHESTPDIVPLATADKWVKSLSGVSLSFMKITFFVNSRKAWSKTGKILFTHFGLSGPLIMNSAREVRKLLKQGRVTALIDAFPDTDLGSLDKQAIKIFTANKNKSLKNIFSELAPHGTTEAILSLLPQVIRIKKVHSLTVEERKNIIRLFKTLPVTITHLMGYDRAVVSDGGIPLDEVNTKTMRSKKIDNLFITGDLLHINRQSGGYSLQLCWTTGFVAGNNASLSAKNSAD